MAESRVERRLAAILAADVAGYSRLMGANEEGTLARFNTHRHELLEPTIAQHRGRIVKRTGDGFLVEFASVVDATRSQWKCRTEWPGAMWASQATSAWIFASEYISATSLSTRAISLGRREYRRAARKNRRTRRNVHLR